MKLTTPEISWHGKEPLFSIHFSLYKQERRLATSGADSNIRIWSLNTDDNHNPKIDFKANLSRHTKAVNVVRFAPKGNVLASGGDDCFVIIWKLNEDTNCDQSSSNNLNNDDIHSTEAWQVIKMLRGHIEDVYDIAWSPNASQLISGSVDNSVIIWDTVKGEKLKLLKDHRQYVQGVCWDPCSNYIASYSSDRTCRIYATKNYRCCYNVNKLTLPNSNKTDGQNPKQIKLFHDETMPSFFRRLTFSPDGSLLIVPGGRFEVNDQPINTTFVFTKASLNKPVMYFPATKKPTIAVRCCPMLFHLRKKDDTDNDTTETTPVFKLPYRMVIAVASMNSVVLYDTQHTCPFAFLSNMHYASLTDIAWSDDGRVIAVSSRDGYCSLVTFEDGELGVPYSQTAQEVIMTEKELIATKKCTTPKPQAPTIQETCKDVTPKIESLSIKKFVTVSPKPAAPPTSDGNIINGTQENPPEQPKAPSAPTGDGNTNTGTQGKPPLQPKASAPRRISFVTLKPAPKPTCPSGTQPPPPVSQKIDGTSPKAAPRRVGFVTLQPGTQGSLIRKEKPPVPLEPDVIVIKD